VAASQGQKSRIPAWVANGEYWVAKAETFTGKGSCVSYLNEKKGYLKNLTLSKNLNWFMLEN